MHKTITKFSVLIAFCTFLTFPKLSSQLFSQDAMPSKTALVLSGGGARGFAHIGVIRALEEAGFYPDLIVGTSMGAIIGGLYACGNTPDEIEQYLKKTKWIKLFLSKQYREIEFASQKIGELPSLFSLRFDEQFNVIFPKNILTTQGLQDRIFQITIYPEFAAGGNFDNLAIPFRAVATDIKTGKPVVLNHGSLAKAVAASSAYPVVLAPVAIDSFLLIDGGATNNVPCDVAKSMGASFIVAVDASSKIVPLGDNIDPLSFMGQMVNTLLYFSDTRNLELADVLIRPDLGEISAADFDSIEVLIKKGYEEAKKYTDKVKPYWNRNHPSPDFFQHSIDLLNHTRIGKIRFVNNQITRPFVLRREMILNEGDLWSQALVKRSSKNLLSTGLFRSVSMSLEKIDDESAALIVDVEEDVRTLFSAGARYDTEKEARAFVSFKYRNLLGVGIDNSLYLIASDQYRRMAWNIHSTRIFTTTLTGNASIYSQAENIPYYQNKKTLAEFSRSGFEINAGVQVSRVGLTSVGIKMERLKVEENSEIDILKSKNRTLSLVFRIFVENTDNYDLPTRGRINNIVYEQSFNRNNLEQHIEKLSVESIVYETYSGRHTFFSHFRFGYLTTVLSPFERFRLGGVTSLPGYYQDEIWGSVVLALGLGYRAPLTLGSYYRFLIMFGDVWDGIESFDWRDIRHGMRAGIIVPTPIGPITLDWGFDLHGRSLIYFSIGHNF